MFNLGFSEVVVILIVALIFLGPSKLPDLARSIGKGMRELKKATDDLKGVWDEEVERPIDEVRPHLAPPGVARGEVHALDSAWPEAGQADEPAGEAKATEATEATEATDSEASAEKPSTEPPGGDEHSA